LLQGLRGVRISEPIPCYNHINEEGSKLSMGKITFKNKCSVPEWLPDYKKEFRENADEFFSKIINSNPIFQDKEVELEYFQQGVGSIVAKISLDNGEVYVIKTTERLNTTIAEIKSYEAMRDEDILTIICSPKARKNKDEIVYKNKLKNNLKVNGSSVKFKYLDNKEILEYFKAADLVLLPSMIEGISIAILESMALSKSVITTRVGGNPEIIKKLIIRGNIYIGPIQ